MSLEVTRHTLVLRGQWQCAARLATVDLKIGDEICGATFNYGTCVLKPGHVEDHLNIVDERWPQEVRRPCPCCGGWHG